MAKRKKQNIGKTIHDVKQKFTLICWLATIALVALVVGRHIAQEQFAELRPQFDVTEAERLQEIAVPDSISNSIVKYKAYTVYFNPDKHVPNATVYELTAEETEGDQPRANNFIHDENVEGCAHAWDYSNSGYDRGHMTPAADMKWDAEAMKQSFYMTNICPQNGQLNSNGWSRLEKKVRSWAKRDSALIVITGPIYQSPAPKTIGKEVDIPVPDAFFKVIYAPRQVRAIAFVYPNEGQCNRKLRKYATSVRSVELLTGLNFFAVLDDDLENRIENQNDFSQWEINSK